MRGSGHSAWIGYYSYFVEILKLNNITTEIIEKLTHLQNLAKNCFWWYPFENICFISEKPSEIHFNENKLLHNETEMSVKFADGWGIYSLNGTLVPDYLVTTSAADLSADLVLKEQNSQVRYEIVKKIGIERVVSDLKAECVEGSNYGVYELLLLDLQDGRKRPFLKMLNPSTFEYHVEGVHPDCKTIQQALNWRNGDRVWSADGAEWQQQGDVLMFPLGATSFKPYPSILT